MNATTLIQHEQHEEPQPEPIEDPKGAVTWYEVLEVSPRAGEVVIQAAYRALARSSHPDLNRHRSAAERMRELNRARDVLMDPRKRSMYDLNIGQQRVSRTADGKLTGGVRRAHTCWRCDQPLAAYTAYCGRCRWLVCESCHGCGCQHPEWQPPVAQPANDNPLLQRVGPLTRLGWLLVVGLASAVALAATAAWSIALR